MTNLQHAHHRSTREELCEKRWTHTLTHTLYSISVHCHCLFYLRFSLALFDLFWIWSTHSLREYITIYCLKLVRLYLPQLGQPQVWSLKLFSMMASTFSLPGTLLRPSMCGEYPGQQDWGYFVWSRSNTPFPALNQGKEISSFLAMARRDFGKWRHFQPLYPHE